MAQDAYYYRDEVSNSDLGWLDKYLHPDAFVTDPHNAYRFGNLVDAIITEPEKLDYFKRTVSDYPDEPFTPEEWAQAEAMKRSFKADKMCMQLLNMSTFQKKFFDTVFLRWGSFQFSLRMRCKFDMFMDPLGWGSDIKSTTAKTQKEFIDACYHFKYNRQRAVYMTLAKSDRDMLIGISKEEPYTVFKLPIQRGDEFFTSGMEEFTDLAFKYWCLFENTGLKYNTISQC